jgi:hypothetical protein
VHWINFKDTTALSWKESKYLVIYEVIPLVKWHTIYLIFQVSMYLHKP